MNNKQPLKHNTSTSINQINQIKMKIIKDKNNKNQQQSDTEEETSEGSTDSIEIIHGEDSYDSEEKGVWCDDDYQVEVVPLEVNYDKESGDCVEEMGHKRNAPEGDIDNRIQKRRKIDGDEKGYQDQNSEDEYSYFKVKKSTLSNFDSGTLRRKLKEVGYVIEEMAPDGNCLFRSVADQIYGDPEKHMLVRTLCMDFMEKERDHYSQFITQEFNEYIERKRQPRCYGNHIELQAIAELYNRPVEIYTYDAEPLNLFQDLYQTDNPPIRISYHYGNHYNSVRDPSNPTTGAGLGITNYKQGMTPEEVFVDQAKTESDTTFLEEQFVKQEIEQSEIEKIEDDLLKQTLEESKMNVEDPEFMTEEEQLAKVLQESRQGEPDNFEDDFLQQALMQSQMDYENEAIMRSLMDY
eukprot:TRINITY_DN12735_c0_g1_i1.p1 TRINITY_DN12735_c0_g1~~TRINITY_DN12735_c0_g1_i1.p1  ORF type:complete len:408 (+),score=100.91 TRINITY_DN12735_c0_g1_i1:1294-2517(+)